MSAKILHKNTTEYPNDHTANIYER